MNGFMLIEGANNNNFVNNNAQNNDMNGFNLDLAALNTFSGNNASNNDMNGFRLHGFRYHV